MTPPTFAHVQGHLELVEQSLQHAYTQLKMAREKLKELQAVQPPKEPNAAG